MIRARGYRFIERKLYDSAWRRRFPLRAMFELTYRCNFTCIHCYVGCHKAPGPRQKELKTAHVLDILGQLKKAGTFFVGFTGGEVFLRPDIFDILWHAKKLGFQIIILTNGSMIDRGVADELARLSVNKVDITVHAIDKKRFDRITGVAGSAQKVFGAIDLLMARNVRVGIKSCGMQENSDQITRISRFARNRHIRFRLDTELIPRLDRSSGPLKHSLSPAQDLYLRKACYPEMFRQPPQAGPRLGRNARVFPCGCGYLHLAINPAGRLKTCIDIDYPRYDLLRKPLNKGWALIKKFVDTLTPPRDWACLDCSVRRYCSWCPAKSYLQDGTFFSCDAQSRARAEYNKKVYSR